MQSRLRFGEIPNKWIIQPLPYILFAPTSIVSVLFTQPAHGELLTPGQWLGISALSYGLFYLLLSLYNLLYLHPRSEQSTTIASLAAVAFVIGFIKGTFVSYCLRRLTPEQTVDRLDLSRSFSAAVISMICVVSLAYLNAELHRIRALRLERITQLTDSESRRMSNDVVMVALAAESRDGVEKELSTALTEIIDSLEDPSLDGPELDAALLKLAGASRDQLTSLTDQLQQDLETEFPKLTWFALFRSVLSQKAFPTLPLTTAIIVTTLGFVFQSSPDDSPLIRIAVIAFCTSLSLSLGNFALSKWQHLGFIGWTFTVMMCAVSPFLVNGIIFGDSLHTYLSNLLLYFFWLLMLCSAACLVNGLLFQRRRIEIDLIDSLDSSRVRERASTEVNRQLLKEMTEYIHGRVQSRLMAAAMTITSAKNSKDHEKVQSELIALRQLAEAPFQSFHAHQNLEFEAIVANLIQTWTGLLEISISQETIELLKHFDSFKISNVIEEALLNSFRHGHAVHVGVVMERKDAHYVLSVIDDGVGPQLGKPNLGSALYDSIANAWSITHGTDGIGARLDLRLEPETPA